MKATLSVMPSKGLSDTNDSSNELSKDDLVNVLVQAEQRLKHVLNETTLQ